MEKKTKIAILGANSFIGKNLVKGFSETEKFEIIALSNSTRAMMGTINDHQLVSPFPFDFNNPDTYKKFSWWSDIEHLVCLVSASKPATFDNSPSQEIYQNVVPYAYFLDFLQKNYRGHLIFISSGGAVYGPVKRQIPINEDAQTRPSGAYGMGKLAIEMLIMNVAKRANFKFTILRLSNPIGRWQELHHEQGVLPAIIRASTRGAPLTVFGDGRTIRDYFDVQEIYQGLLRLFQYDQARNQVYNFGSGVGHSVLELISLVERVSGKRIQTQKIPKRLFDVDYNVLDCTKLSSAINWKPDSDIDHAVECAWRHSNNFIG